MSKVKCLYCGSQIPEDAEQCPECGKRSHFKKSGRPDTRKFIFWFILVSLLCGFLVLWFPR